MKKVNNNTIINDDEKIDEIFNVDQFDNEEIDSGTEEDKKINDIFNVDQFDEPEVKDIKDEPIIEDTITKDDEKIEEIFDVSQFDEEPIIKDKVIDEPIIEDTTIIKKDESITEEPIIDEEGDLFDATTTIEEHNKIIKDTEDLFNQSIANNKRVSTQIESSLDDVLKKADAERIRVNKQSIDLQAKTKLERKKQEANIKRTLEAKKNAIDKAEEFALEQGRIAVTRQENMNNRFLADLGIKSEAAINYSELQDKKNAAYLSNISNSYQKERIEANTDYNDRMNIISKAENESLIELQRGEAKANSEYISTLKSIALEKNQNAGDNAKALARANEQKNDALISLYDKRNKDKLTIAKLNESTKAKSKAKNDSKTSYGETGTKSTSNGKDFIVSGTDSDGNTIFNETDVFGQKKSGGFIKNQDGAITKIITKDGSKVTLSLDDNDQPTGYVTGQFVGPNGNGDPRELQMFQGSDKNKNKYNLLKDDINNTSKIQEAITYLGSLDSQGSNVYNNTVAKLSNVLGEDSKVMETLKRYFSNEMSDSEYEELKRQKIDLTILSQMNFDAMRSILTGAAFSPAELDEYKKYILHTDTDPAKLVQIMDNNKTKTYDIINSVVTAGKFNNFENAMNAITGGRQIDVTSDNVSRRSDKNPTLEEYDKLLKDFGTDYDLFSGQTQKSVDQRIKEREETNVQKERESFVDKETGIPVQDTLIEEYGVEQSSLDSIRNDINDLISVKDEGITGLLNKASKFFGEDAIANVATGGTQDFFTDAGIGRSIEKMTNRITDFDLDITEDENGVVTGVKMIKGDQSKNELMSKILKKTRNVEEAKVIFNDYMNGLASSISGKEIGVKEDRNIAFDVAGLIAGGSIAKFGGPAIKKVLSKIPFGSKVPKTEIDKAFKDITTINNKLKTELSSSLPKGTIENMVKKINFKNMNDKQIQSLIEKEIKNELKNLNSKGLFTSLKDKATIKNLAYGSAATAAISYVINQGKALTGLSNKE